MPIDLWYIVPGLATGLFYFIAWYRTLERPPDQRELLREALLERSKPFVGATLRNKRAVAPSVIHARGAFGLGGPMCGGAAASLLMNDGMRAQQNIQQQAQLQGLLGSGLQAVHQQQLSSNHPFFGGLG